MMYNRQMRIVMTIVIVIFLLHAFSCNTTMNSELKKGELYKMDIGIETMNPENNYIGMASVGRKDLHTFYFTADDRIDLMLIRTCSREVVLTEPKSSFNKKRYIYNFKPNEIEMGGNCDMRVEAFNKNLLYSSGFISFQNEATILPAKVVCEDKTTIQNGVSVCQSKINSIEKVSFDTEVRVKPDPGCELESGSKGTEFEFKIKPGLCVYAFISSKPPYMIHRLTTYGYSSIAFHLE